MLLYSPVSEPVERSKGRYWIEVDPKISYRKIGHAFRSNSRRRTAEKYAEIAIAEEAARTRKSYEEVQAKTNVKRFKSPKSTESHTHKYAVAPTGYRPAPSLVPPNIGVPGDVSPSKDVFTPTTSSTSTTSSTEQLIQLEVRRKLLLEEEQRLFEMRLGTSMRSIAPLPAVGPIMYCTTMRGSMTSPADLPSRPRLCNQRSILTNAELAGCSHLQVLYDTDRSLIQRGFPSLRHPLWMTSPPGIMTLNSDSRMTGSKFGSRRDQQFTSGAVKDLSILHEEQLVNALLRRAQLTKTSSVRCR
jgi:hypothetical protein